MKNRCWNCNNPVKGGKFCKHCGADLKKHEKINAKKCPNCNAGIEHGSLHCAHCGYRLGLHTRTSTSPLLYFAIAAFLLFILLVLYALLTPLSMIEEPTETLDTISVTETQHHVDIDNISCIWKNNNFEVCETVSWSGSGVDYAKGYITNGESLRDAPAQLESPFTYCQTVGSKEQVIQADAVLYSAADEIYSDVSRSVQCKKPPITFVRESTSFEKKIFFTASRVPGGGSRGSGTINLEIPGNPVECSLEGDYIVDDRGTQRYQSYCHGASGSFNSYADQYGQYTVDDAEFFGWASLTKPKTNPAPARRDSYILYMYTCDNQYYSSQGPRYYLRARITEFSKNMKIEWEYRNDESPRQEIKVNTNVICKINSNIY